MSWKDNKTLFEDTAAVCPMAALNRYNLGMTLAKAGFHEEAVWQLAVTAGLCAAYPALPELPAFEAETLPLKDRLTRLPELSAEPDADAFFAGLHAFLLSKNLKPEARIVEQLAAARKP